jgi:hypothetical protein
LKNYFGDTANDISAYELGAFYSFLNPDWHASLGGGVAFLDIRGKSSEGKESSLTVLSVPNFQVRLYWRVIGIMFLNMGYRGDFYPGGFGDLLSKSSKPAPNEKFFWGHNLMFGMTVSTFSFANF